jgi:mycothiol synthase
MRHILKLHRSLTVEIPATQNGFEIATFDPKFHKAEWLELNNKIFINHPDQGNWAIEDLENRMAEPWFDPEGFFIAFENKKMIGFCWTKIHHDFVNQDPVAELYVIGVDPDSRTKGIGNAVAVTALNYLKEKGLNQAMLYVDADNSKALKLYESLGFN